MPFQSERLREITLLRDHSQRSSPVERISIIHNDRSDSSNEPGMLLEIGKQSATGT